MKTLSSISLAIAFASLVATIAFHILLGIFTPLWFIALLSCITFGIIGVWLGILAERNDK